MYDAGPFATVGRDGFHVLEIDDEKAGCISAVRYPGGLGFIGSFIVRRDLRGRGFGRLLLQRALEGLADTVGLDAPPQLQPLFERAGFSAAYRSVRFQLDAREPRDRFASAVALSPLRVVDDDLVAYDAACFGAKRESFLQSWIVQPDAVALVARSIAGGEVLGFGVGRDCREGTKIAPLFASRLDIAAILYDTIAQRTRSPWFIDVPTPNLAAVGFANERGMEPVLERIRMWRGTPPPIEIAKVYGVTSFEVG